MNTALLMHAFFVNLLRVNLFTSRIAICQHSAVAASPRVDSAHKPSIARLNDQSHALQG